MATAMMGYFPQERMYPSKRFWIDGSFPLYFFSAFKESMANLEPDGFCISQVYTEYTNGGEKDESKEDEFKEESLPQKFFNQSYTLFCA